MLFEREEKLVKNETEDDWCVLFEREEKLVKNETEDDWCVLFAGGEMERAGSWA